MSTLEPGPIPAENPPVVVGKTWITVLAASILAAGLGWGFGETGLARVSAQEGETLLLGQKIKGATKETLRAAEIQTAARTYGVLGLLIGLAAGFAGGSVAGSSKARIRAGALGAVVAGVAGAASAIIVVPIQDRLMVEGASEQIRAYVSHGGIWLPIGAAAGLALGVGMGRGKILTALIGGVVGAGIGSILFDILGGLAFPNGGIHLPVPSAVESRLTAHLLLAVSTVSLALFAATSTKSRRKPDEVKASA